MIDWTVICEGDPFFYMIYLLTAIELSPSGSSCVCVGLTFVLCVLSFKLCSLTYEQFVMENHYF